jgi:hypothetical protein
VLGGLHGLRERPTHPLHDPEAACALVPSRRGRVAPAPDARCVATACRERVPLDTLMCPGHWARVPTLLKAWQGRALATRDLRRFDDYLEATIGWLARAEGHPLTEDQAQLLALVGPLS